jgi:hypothetical protein
VPVGLKSGEGVFAQKRFDLPVVDLSDAAKASFSKPSPNCTAS